MKKPYIIFFVLVLILSGCTPKRQIYNSAIDILEEVEKTCIDISDDVEKLNDEYTIGVFETIKESIAEQRTVLSDNPSKDEIQNSLISLSRLEKDLGSVKILASGMSDYIPELTFEFINNTESVVKKIVLKAEGKDEIEAFSGEIVSKGVVTISYPEDVGKWSVTVFMQNDDEVTGEGISLATINALVLNSDDGGYAFTTN